jgi:hypothetical protein
MLGSAESAVGQLHHRAGDGEAEGVDRRLRGIPLPQGARLQTALDKCPLLVRRRSVRVPSALLIVGLHQTNSARVPNVENDPKQSPPTFPICLDGQLRSKAGVGALLDVLKSDLIVNL